MKKILFSVCLMSFAFSTYAQMNKRTFVGGNVNASWSKRSSNYENSTTSSQTKENWSSLQVMPTAGYFLSEHFAIGLGIGYSYGNSKSENDRAVSYPGYYYLMERKSNSALFRPFVRYNHLFANNKVGLSTQLEVGGGFGENKYTFFYPDSTKTSPVNFHSFSAGIRPGIILMVTQRIGLEATFGYLGYQFYKENGSNGYNPDASAQTNYQFFDFDFGLTSLYFGMQFYFGGKDKEN